MYTCTCRDATTIGTTIDAYAQYIQIIRISLNYFEYENNSKGLFIRYSNNYSIHGLPCMWVDRVE